MAVDRLCRELERQQDALDDHQRRIGHLEVEEERTRQRLHRLEGDRQMMRSLVETTRALAEQTRALAAEVSSGVRAAEQLAESAAEKAVAKAFERKKAGRWRLTGRLASHMAGLGAFGSLITYLIAHFLT